MDAIKFILSEHRRFKKMLTNLTRRSTDTETKREIFESLSQQLLNHEKMEEKKWYPFLKKNMKVAVIIKHLVGEEKSAGKEIKKIRKITSDEKFESKLPDFKNAVLHHAGEEEEKLFPKVQKAIDKKDLADIGKVLQEYKNELDRN